MWRGKFQSPAITEACAIGATIVAYKKPQSWVSAKDRLSWVGFFDRII